LLKTDNIEKNNRQNKNLNQEGENVQVIEKSQILSGVGSQGSHENSQTVTSNLEPNRFSSPGVSGGYEQNNQMLGSDQNPTSNSVSQELSNLAGNYAKLSDTELLDNRQEIQTLGLSETHASFDLDPQGLNKQSIPPSALDLSSLNSSSSNTLGVSTSSLIDPTPLKDRMQEVSSQIEELNKKLDLLQGISDSKPNLTDEKIVSENLALSDPGKTKNLNNSDLDEPLVSKQTDQISTRPSSDGAIKEKGKKNQILCGEDASAEESGGNNDEEYAIKNNDNDSFSDIALSRDILEEPLGSLSKHSGQLKDESNQTKSPFDHPNASLQAKELNDENPFMSTKPINQDNGYSLQPLDVNSTLEIDKGGPIYSFPTKGQSSSGRRKGRIPLLSVQKLGTFKLNQTPKLPTIKVSPVKVQTLSVFEEIQSSLEQTSISLEHIFNKPLSTKLTYGKLEEKKESNVSAINKSKHSAPISSLIKSRHSPIQKETATSSTIFSPTIIKIAVSFAVISLWSLNTSAPCPDQSCSFKQIGAPLMNQDLPGVFNIPIFDKSLMENFNLLLNNGTRNG